MARMTKENYDAYITRVGAKCQKMMTKLAIPGQRNDEAIATHTIPGIIEAQRNFFFSSYGDVDAVQELYAHFSGTESADVEASGGRGVEDITILAAIKSIAGYIAIDRAMTDPDTTITYNQIVAVNSKGSINAGDKLYDQFSRVPTGLDLKMTRSTKDLTAGSANTLNYGGAIVPGTVVISIKGDGSATKGEIVGTDNKDGTMSFRYVSVSAPAGTTLITIPSDVVINYSAGTVALTVEADVVGTGTATVDSLSSTTAIQRVKGKIYVPTTLHAESESLVLEGNLQADAYRNKAMRAQLEAGLTMDYAQMNFRQTLEMYVEYINLKMVQAVHNAAMVAIATQVGNTYIAEDISTAAIATSDPKYIGYAVNKFIEDLNAENLRRCKHGTTAIVTGIQGARILATIDKTFGTFVKSPEFDSEADGYCGTFNGIPVIRHAYIDGVSDAKYANFYAIYKDASGKAGPVAFGTYLPLYTTEKALNFDNPMQFAQGLFSYLAIQTLVPELVAVGRIK